MQQNIQYQEDEIDLKELLKTILKYKKFIIIFTFIITTLSIIFVLLKTPIYQVKSNIQIGYINGKLIDDPTTIVKVARLVFHVDDPINTQEQFISDVSDISLNKKIKNFITIKTDAISNQEALKKNKEVVTFIQNKYKNKINEYIRQNNNKINNIKLKIYNLEHKSIVDTKREIKKLKDQNITQIDEKINKLQTQDIANIQREIKKLKDQNITQIDEKINKLQTQDIANIQREIKKLKNQDIAQIDEKINFYKNTKINSIQNKRKFYQDKLKEYQNSISKIYQNNINNKNKTTATIASLKMVNYQNLILDEQNKIEDLRLQLNLIKTEKIPNLQIKKDNINNITIKDLETKIKNIQNITIKNLQIQKDNIQKDTIKNLEYTLNIILPNKKRKLLKQIEDLKYLNSSDNVQNSKVIGGYVMHNYPIKPKKKLIVIVAFVTSLILSIFIVFFLEFLKEDEEK